MINLDNLHAKVLKLFKAGIVNLEGRNPINKTPDDVAYIATEDLSELSKKWRNQSIYKNGHFDDGTENHKHEIVGKVGDTWIEGEWVMGTGLFTEEGLNELLGKGVSISYNVSQAIPNNMRDKKEGFEYDYRILDMIPDHIAIVDNPRYQGAGLKHNSINEKNHLIICEQKLKHNQENFKKDIDIINFAYNNNIKYEPLTKIFDMFSIKKKHNNVHESEEKSEMHPEKKDNTSEMHPEKKYANFSGRKMMGLEEGDFKQRVTEAYEKKHNSDLSEDEDALEHMIEIEHMGEKIEMTLREAMELIEASEKVVDVLESREKEEILEDKNNDNGYPISHASKHNNVKEERPYVKENMAKKHNSYMQSLKSSVTYSSNAVNSDPNVDYLEEKARAFKNR